MFLMEIDRSEWFVGTRTKAKSYGTVTGDHIYLLKNETSRTEGGKTVIFDTENRVTEVPPQDAK